MKVLVTDASGFVGNTLIEELDTLGFEVRVLVPKGKTLPKKKGNDGVKFHAIEGDLSDFESLCRAVCDVDYVFHLAEVTSARSRAAFFEYNAKGTERLARAVSETQPGLSRFVYLSSLAAAGPAHSLKPRVENEPESKDQPISDYGKSKLQGEKELLKFRHQFPISIVRPSLVYGPKDKAGFLLIQAVSRNVMPILTGSTKGGHKYYSAIHAKDLCRGIVQAAVASKKKVASGEIFYLSGDGVHTYQELMAVLAERLNCDPLKIKVPKFILKTAAVGLSTFGWATGKAFPLNRDRLNEFLSDYWICSNKKAKRVLGFVPEFDLPSGLANSIDWYKRQRWL